MPAFIISPLGPTFDFYVSPTGNDANPGTVAQPWAITSLVHTSSNYSLTTGKRIGFLPGTYDVSGMYVTGDSVTGCFQIDGGPTASASTYYGSSDASGHYSPRTALIQCQTVGGQFGGGVNALPAPPVLAHTGSTTHHGNIVIDGLRFTGYSWKCVRIGDNGTIGAIAGSVVIQNCEFFGAGQNAGSPNDNMPSIWLDGLHGGGPYTITNNYFHDNIPQNTLGQEGITAVQAWQCWGLQITYNTVVKSGGFNGKIDNIQGNTIAYNYLDNSAFSASGGVRGLDDWTGNPTAGLTQTSSFHHNIFIVGGWGLECQGTSANAPWTTPANVYNNTIVLNSGGPYPAIMMGGSSTNAGQMNFYNNLVSGSADGSGYSTFRTSPKAIGIFDYNGHMTSANFALFTDGTNTEGTGTQYSSDSAFAAGVVAGGGVSGCQAHAVSNSSPQFTGTGHLAQQYQLQASSPFHNAGSTDGTTGGAACDMGAWGYDPALNGPPSRIGADWA